MRLKTKVIRFVLLITVITILSCERKKTPTLTQTTQQPSYGDIYVAALLGDASYLNPILATDSASGAINNLVFNGLVKYDKNINLVGDLAESWQISNDGLTITFNLRKDVLWHDGVPFTAEDVRFTYEKLIDPNTKTPYSSDYLLIKSFEVINPYKLRVTYKQPFAPALESWGMGIIPKHIYSTPPHGFDFNSHPANRKPIGTGPFKFESWRTDEKIVLVANDKYFEGRPFIDRVIYRIVPDQSVQFLELRKEALDEMGLTPDQFKAYDEFFKMYNKFRYPAFSYTYLGFNLKNPLFSDVRVRRAIAHAIEKSQIIDGVLLGMGKPATGPFPPTSWAFNPEVVDYEYDLQKAKKLLEECGWIDYDNDGWIENKNLSTLNQQPPKFEFTIMTNQGNKLRALTAEIIQSQLKKIGIKVNIRIIEWSTFIHQFIDKRNFDAVILGWSLSRDPDQYSIWHSEQSKPGKYNFVSYKNPEVDRLLEVGRQTFEHSRRQKIYRRIHKLLHSDVPYIFLYYPEALPVIHKRFIGPEVAPLGIGWNFREWWVPPDKIKYKTTM